MHIICSAETLHLDASPFDPLRKYIQVCVQNVSDASFQLAELSLSEKQEASLELQSLNTKAQQVAITNSLLRSYLVCGYFISYLCLLYFENYSAEIVCNNIIRFIL